MSLLVAVEEGDFNFLLKRTGATRGNLSVQIAKLREAGYISVHKSFRDNYPNTTCAATYQGIRAFENYVSAIRNYLEPRTKGGS